jgi:hypothetical protein
LKNALRELSALEAAIRAAQKENGPAPELAALAEALKQAGQSNDAADAMQRGDFEKAAAQIGQAAADPDAREKLAQALREALEKMQGAQGGEMMRQMEQAAQSAQQRSQALQRLAEMLRQMGGSGQRPQQRSGISSEAARQLLSMLQDMKSGPSDGKQGGRPMDGKFAPSPGQQGGGKDKPPVEIVANSDIPSGRPGSEHDLGTTETPFGNEQAPKAGAGEQGRLEGVLGEGESRQSLVSAAGGAGKAGQRYRALYDAMAPDAEQAVAHENIPPGSRFFVRRYFETIRPAE